MVNVPSRLAFTPLTEVHMPLVRRNYPFIPPGPNNLVISEVLYNPDTSQLDTEWIEVYNPTDLVIDLSDYKVGDAEALGKPEGMLKFPSGAMIMPKQVILIAANANKFLDVYGLNPDFEMSNSSSIVPDM